MAPIDDLRNRLANPRPGGVVLFTGAGFSVGAKNELNEEVPLARGLARKIAEQIGLNDDLPLTLAAEIYNERMSDDRAFLRLIKRSFTVAHATKAQREIASYPWRRIYTTNYDNLIEFVEPRIESLDRERLAFELELGKQIVHLNGSVRSLRDDSSVNDLQITMGHYFDKDLFDTAWASTFRSDLELCHSIVFAGYSMYDPDVSRIVFSDPSLKEKAFIVQRVDLPIHEERWLGRFGAVLKIANDGLSELVSAIRSDGGPRVSNVSPENFSELLIGSSSVKDYVMPEDVAALLERGIFSRAKYEASRVAGSPDYICKRSVVGEVVDAIKNGERNILLHADMGNGKTVVIEAACRDIVGRLGKQVFFFEGGRTALDFDVAALSRMDTDYVLVFEGFFENQKEIEIFRSQLSNAIILVSERTASFELRNV